MVSLAVQIADDCERRLAANIERYNQLEGCQPMTCEGDPKREGAQGVNGRGTQPLNPFFERQCLLLGGRIQWDARDQSTEAKP